MTEATAQSVTNKEPQVLSDTSLQVLAKGIGQQDFKGLELAMYLNIPTTTIIKSIYSVTDKPLTREGAEKDTIIVTAKCIWLWREMTKNGKISERIKSLERALRELGKPEVADLLLEHHQNNQELTSDIFT